MHRGNALGLIRKVNPHGSRSIGRQKSNNAYLTQSNGKGGPGSPLMNEFEEYTRTLAEA